MRYKRASGERVGTVPFGFQIAADGVHFEQDASEQAIVGRARSMKASGLTLKRIAEALNAAGFTTRRGTAWRLQYVADMLKTAA